MRKSALCAFTLVELLIAVAIIAILAAIAVPNLLESQARSKVSRAKADLRTLKTALEAYAVDENSYPVGGGGLGFAGNLTSLTSPRQYIASVPRDVFQRGATYFYASFGKELGITGNPFGGYVVASVGPDGQNDTTLVSTLSYDPTNGTLSRGDIADPQSGRQHL